MANIKLQELSSLNLSGTELFNDSESLLTELSQENDEMATIIGGGGCGLCTKGVSIICHGFSIYAPH